MKPPRIRAADALLAKCADHDITEVKRADDVPLPDPIVLKDENKNVIDYVDTEQTNGFRKRLEAYNKKLEATSLTVDGVKADTSLKRLHRVFNNSNFNQGGRFYGGFWQSLRQREFKEREKLRINGKQGVELDFKALHPSFLYAIFDLPVPDDCYTIEGIRREDVKAAFLVIINCRDRQHALNTMRHEKKIKDAAKVLAAIEQHHAPIKEYFYSPIIGSYLQHMDSIIVDTVIEELLAEDILVLPIHDSFIVEEEHEDRLRQSMNDVINFYVQQTVKIDKKY